MQLFVLCLIYEDACVCACVRVFCLHFRRFVCVCMLCLYIAGICGCLLAYKVTRVGTELEWNLCYPLLLCPSAIEQRRRQRSKGARSFWGQKILKPSQVIRNPGRREGLACPQWSDRLTLQRQFILLPLPKQSSRWIFLPGHLSWRVVRPGVAPPLYASEELRMFTAWWRIAKVYFRLHLEVGRSCLYRVCRCPRRRSCALSKDCPRQRWTRSKKSRSSCPGYQSTLCIVAIVT